MSESYNKKILLIYLTKTAGIVTGFLSLLMVVPRLTSNADIYGIYTVCISLNMFFSYADLGFLAAGQKYAAEYFAQKNLDKEMRVIGFVLFFLSVLVTVCLLILLFIAFNPDILINSKSATDLEIGSKLILILALFSPMILFQRFNSLLYSIRIEDYIYQSIDIASNFLKIISIQLFVTKNSYDIVGYFLTIQILSLLSGVIGATIGIVRYRYSVKRFLSCFKFSIEMYERTKALAFSSLLTTIAWILYFELDSVILSKYYGLRVVAMYAIAFTFLSFARTIYNTLYSPFLSRFNHFVGINDEDGLYKNYCSLIKWTFPLCITPPLILTFYMKSIIITWVGYNYLSSVFISQLFVLTTAISALSIPIGYLMIAKSKNSILRINAVILPVVFFASLVYLNYYVAERSLAIAKVMTIACSFILTVYFIYIIAGRKILILYAGVVRTMILPVVIMLSLFLFMPNSTDIEPGTFKAYVNLFWHLIPSLLLPLIVYYLLEAQTRNFIISKIAYKIGSSKP